MPPGQRVKELRFYTHSSRAHNRQIFVQLSDGSEVRFTEGEMAREQSRRELGEVLLKVIEEAAYQRAMRFRNNGEDWAKVQVLMHELQSLIKH